MTTWRVKCQLHENKNKKIPVIGKQQRGPSKASQFHFKRLLGKTFQL